MAVSLVHGSQTQSLLTASNRTTMSAISDKENFMSNSNTVVTARKPKAKGMKFVKFERISLDKITVRPGKNTSRLAGIGTEHTDEFVQCMENGDYEPEYHIPPVVTVGPKDTYYLESGEHRYQAHVKMDDNGWPEFATFYAAVVEFYDTDNHPANYWREVWVTLENTRIISFVRKTTNKDDIANSVANLVNQKLIGRDDNSIDESIKEMGVNPSAGMFNTIKSLVWKHLGNGAKVVTGIPIKLKEQVIKEYTNRESLTQEPISATFKELDDADYDWRLLKKLYKMYTKNPRGFNKTLVIAHTNGADPKKVRDIRNRKKTLLSRFATEMKKFVEALQTSGYPFEVDLRWMRQLDGEFHDDKPYTFIEVK